MTLLCDKCGAVIRDQARALINRTDKLHRDLAAAFGDRRRN